MDKVKTGIYLEKEVLEQFRQLAKQLDVNQNRLFKDMLQAYLILNSKDRKDEE